MIIKKADLTTIPAAKKIFEEAENVMLPKGIYVREKATTVPLQNLLDHTTQRLGNVCLLKLAVNIPSFVK